MAEDDNIIIEGLGKGKINYGMVVMMHLDRIAKAGTAPIAHDEKAQDTFCNGIRGLDSLLEPYKDKDYEDDVKKIKAKDPDKSIRSNDQYYAWFGLLVKLIRNAGLLPAEERFLMDDGDESDYIVA